MNSQSDMPRPDEGTNARSYTALRNRWLLTARAIWIALVVLSVGLYIACAWPVFAAYPNPCVGPASLQYCLGIGSDSSLVLHFGVPASLLYGHQLALEVVRVLVFWALAMLIFWKKSDDWVGLLVSFTLVTLGASWEFLSVVGFLHPKWYPLVALVFYAFGYASLLLSSLLFPNGQFVPRWMRWVAVVGVLFVACAYMYEMSHFHISRELVPTSMSNESIIVLYWSWSSLVAIAIVAQAYRYLRISNLVQRQQSKFVIVATIVWAVWKLANMFLLPVLYKSINRSVEFPWIWGAAFELIQEDVDTLILILIPVSIAIAILRYRLWDIDIIINRTLVYGTLTAVVVGIYVLVVGISGSLFRTENSMAGSLIAAGIVAVLFAPLRDRLQRGVNRLMYGERDDPYKVLSDLGERLDSTLTPDAVLPAVAETVAGTLKLPYAAITLKQDGEFVEATKQGKKEGAGELLTLPLTYQNEEVGKLLLTPRAPGEPFSKSDVRLLKDLARQAGVAAYAVRLTADLQRSRERLVAAREEERRRLRRDLHDGVGPQLAALMLELETASELVADDPEASALMSKLSERTRDVVSDVRRSVHALRPPTLDELGLVGALREGAAQYSRGNLRVSVDAPENLLHLPAAVEVACYRIAEEAMTNVVRHAGASNCWVRIKLHEEAEMMRLEVEDDGRGLKESDKAGVGMSSMRERAEELGGTCTIESRPQGYTLVRAILPCRIADTICRTEHEP